MDTKQASEELLGQTPEVFKNLPRSIACTAKVPNPANDNKVIPFTDPSSSWTVDETHVRIADTGFTFRAKNTNCFVYDTMTP